MRPSAMVPPARQNSPPEPTYYFLCLDEGLWTLSKPRGSKGKLVSVDSFRIFEQARAGAIARAKSDPHGVFLTISGAVNFRRHRDSFEFPPRS